VSAVANTLIDKLGHEMVNVNGKFIPRRTPLTHTWFRSVLWGFGLSVPIFMILPPVYHYYQLWNPIILMIVYGLSVGPSHMLLDVFTEKGIYVKKDGKWVRFALAHFKYNDPFINTLAIITGILLLLLSFGVFKLIY
jgi:hypothetical protein